MTDDRNDLPGPPPEPPAPPPLPDPAPPPPQPPAVAVAPAKAPPWGWIVAAILALALLALVILYFTGAFDSDRPPAPATPTSIGAPTPPTSTGEPTRSGLPAPSATGGQMTEQWLLGAWGQDCPGVNDPQLTFQPGGRFLLGTDPGDWTVAGDVVTVRRDGRPNSVPMRWEYLSQDSAMVTRLSTGDTYTVYRCP